MWEMMLKNMGVDPVQIKQMAADMLEEFRTLRETVQRVERNQQLILEKLDGSERYEGQPAGNVGVKN